MWAFSLLSGMVAQKGPSLFSRLSNEGGLLSPLGYGGSKGAFSLISWEHGVHLLSRVGTMGSFSLVWQ